MNSNLCEFCDKSFKCAQNLKVHKETAKYCLKLREEIAETNDKTACFVCEYCDNPFTQKKSLNIHYKTCSKYKDHIIEEKNNEIQTLTKKKNTEIVNLTKKKNAEIASLAKKNKNLEEKIAKLEKDIAYKDGYGEGYGNGYGTGVNVIKPAKITNNVIFQRLKSLPVTTIQPLTISLVKKTLCDYTFDMYMRGELGVVQYIEGITALELEDGTVETNYTSTDRSRCSFHRLAAGKEWRADGGAKFIDTILTQLSPKVLEYSNKIAADIKNPGTNNNMREALSFDQKRLTPFDMGVIHPKSRDRVILLKKIRASVKDINYIGAFDRIEEMGELEDMVQPEELLSEDDYH